MTNPPQLEDYVRLFESYGEDMNSIYLKSNDSRYEFLFQQATRLLAQHSAFNATIPAPFRVTAQNYINGDEQTVRHMNYPENRHFMLSDLYDFVMLKKCTQKRQHNPYSA